MYGVGFFGDGGGLVVEDNRFDGNTYIAIFARGDGSIVRRNLVRDTGGSSAVTGQAFGIYTVFSVDVLDNVVDAVLPSASGGNATSFGIRTDLNPNGRIHGNSVRSLLAYGNGTVYGISSFNHGGIRLRGNHVTGSGPIANSIGLRSDNTQARAKDNIVGNFLTSMSGCGDAGGNDFKVGGLAAGTGTSAYGIYAHSRLNTTVRNCNVRGFLIGIGIFFGGGHLIEHNGLDGNTSYAIAVDSPGSTIRGNRVIDTGGSTLTTGYAYGIHAAYGVDVLDNTVDGVAATPNSGNSWSAGVVTESNGDGSVAGNRVRGLAASGSGVARGIYNGNSGRLIVRDNDLQGSGAAFSVGVLCSNTQATARGNVVAGFATGILNCLSSGDTVNTN